ncbi:ABC transporter ATP-binding protein [Schlegelella sp. S2-27]|uniref:ABC transporter ATP-binding protein n=1 Tax=Caldimonas mangrovi TaxID=2944811 RepID=A0ABT0YPI8_9BURK|nr:ABC transporter ATP-binding protein [Caldimonas mangrovi]MCM5680649.1 ABC transporter ATP-binding protein [Caldimonas mangrovi]
MLQTLGLSKHFGATRALDGVTLNVEPGEIYCLLGANGAGKTTLINVFLNFTEPTTGQALVDGLDATRQPLEAKRRLAYIPEQVMLYGMLSGLENLRYFAALATGRELPRDELIRLLVQASLDEGAAHRRVNTYSKGMRQKVGIAIAMAKQAKALLLDEPTSGLDPKAAAEFSQLLRTARDQGVAVLTTTHDLFHAKQTGTRIGIMRQGRLVDEMRAEDLSHTDLEALYLEHMK